MRPTPVDPARRALLLRSVDLVGLVALAAALGRSTPAAAKAAKSEFLYQEHRHNGKSCGDCKFFSPDGASGDRGTCSIVEGVISREGWCTAFAPRILA